MSQTLLRTPPVLFMPQKQAAKPMTRALRVVSEYEPAGDQPTAIVVFALTLGYSRRAFSWPSRNETQASVFEALEAAFHHFGGVPKTTVSAATTGTETASQLIQIVQRLCIRVRTYVIRARGKV